MTQSEIDAKRHYDDTLFRVWPEGTVQCAEDGEPYSHIVRAQTRSKHRVRCIGAEAFVRELPLWLSSTEWLALDDICFWPQHMRNEAVHGAKRESRLKLLMVAH